MRGLLPQIRSCVTKSVILGIVIRTGGQPRLFCDLP